MPASVPAAPPEPVRFPLSWLLEHAAPPLQYRAVTEVARLEGVDRSRLAALPLSYRPALTLALQQSSDGTWNQRMLTLPSGKGAEHFAGVRSEEHTSELQSHRDLHSFPTRRSSDLTPGADPGAAAVLGWYVEPAHAHPPVGEGGGALRGR